MIHKKMDIAKMTTLLRSLIMISTAKELAKVKHEQR